MIEDLGQQSKVWNNWWGGISPLSEIQMWDFYGGRQWISKYTPRYGKVIEAGCGVGRYVFYFRRLGIDIEGIDFSETVIEKLELVKNQIESKTVFKIGDILELPYVDNSLSGYISLGVIEHFIDGPQNVIAEAYKKLRPGGIAIITTPNKSFLILYRNFLKSLKNGIKKLLGRKIAKLPFFQYEYTANQLKKFMQAQGFYVSRAESCDLLYTFCEIGKFKGNNLTEGKFAYTFTKMFENTFLKKYGAQSITISVKKAPLMYCFLSGKLNAYPDSLDKFDVPISKEYQDTHLAKLFLKNRPVKFENDYIINPPILAPHKRICSFSGKEYTTDQIFENYGFNIPVSPEELKKAEISLKLCSDHLKPIWRMRKNNN